MIVVTGLVILAKLILVSTMLVVLGMKAFGEEIPSELLASAPADREFAGDPIDADYQRLPL